MIQRRSLWRFLWIAAAGISTAGLVGAQVSKGPVARYTAVAANVGNAGEKIRIDILSWSSDAERDQFSSAWTSGAPAGGAPAGRGGGRGAPPANVPAPPGAGAPPPAEGGAGAARGGAPARGAGPRGAPGAPGAAGGRGGAAGPAGLTAVLSSGTTKGILWTSDSLGYALPYAFRSADPAGGERIVLITDRRLGGWNNTWKPTGTGTPSTDDFTVIELRLNGRGEGQGKASLTGGVGVDAALKSVVLENFDSAPVVLDTVRRQTTP